MKRLLASLIAIPLLLGWNATAHGQAHMTARLSGDQEVPGVATAAKGSSCLTLTSLGVQFFITVEGLSGPITAAHFHRAAAGVNGAVVRTVTGDFIGNSAVGMWTAADAEPLTSALIDDLLSGNLYLNVHTAANPGGEVRGQVVLSAGVHLTANLNGNQENPVVAVAAVGTGTFTLTGEGLVYKITLNGLTGAITGAHVHRGAIGVNGPVLFDIQPTFSGNTATGTRVMTAAERRDLIAGDLYVNIHTAANPTGEIRGQINLAGGFGFHAPLDGGQEVPPNAVLGTGTGSLTLTPSGLLIDVSATGLSGAITNAHVHRAPAGVNGAVVRTLTADFAGTNAQALWRFDDAEPLTPALVADLFNDNLYLNIHTAAFADGEIRGQIRFSNLSAAPTASFTGNLTGDQEEPPLAVAGKGTGVFRLTSAGLAFNITVNGLTGAITAAHFHNGTIGVNGGVVRTLTAAFVGGTASGLWAPADAEPLTAALITELLKGNLYVNIHTGANPGGEIRGQVLLASGAGFEARLTGSQENPPLAVVGTGTGSFTLTPSGLVVGATVTALTGAISAAHIHQGAPGVNGGVVRNLTFVANNAIDVWKPSDAQPLTTALITDLLKGNLYVNVHTAANPGGEIRGQNRLAEGDARGATLYGGSEVPPVNSPGAGTASMTLTDQGLVFRLSANDLTGAFTDAHFHNAPAGVNGPVVRSILADFTNLTADGVWKPSDASPLTTTLMGELVNDNLYLNVHTTAFGGGEIRGQTGQRSVVGVANPPGGASPQLQLANAPNPVADRTTISFRLPRPSMVDLEVYDITGGLVATVMKGLRPAGSQQATFDARGLRNGVYFYRLNALGLSRTQRMVVIR